MAPPTSPLSAGGAFPRGTYAKYKRATSFFLSWLLRARRAGSGVAPQLPLDVYDAIVSAIAAAPTSLAPALLQRLPRALQACESAITLRARVALFLGDAADDAHAHFLSRLQGWFQTLSTAWNAYQDEDTGSTQKAHVDLSNYYEVLALPDDYFPDENDEGSADPRQPAPAAVPPLSKADRKRLQGEVFADDFRTELACMFMELDELSEAVYAAFLDVKRETKTLVEATVVAKVAIDSAASVIASFQVRHPTLRDGNDLATTIQDGLTLDQIARLVASVQTAWLPSDDPTEIRHQYVPGTVLVDIVGIVRLLSSVATGKGTPLRTLGERYDEATTPHFVVPEWGRMPPFFTYHLPEILNLLYDIRSNELYLTSHTLEKWLLEPFDTFSKTGAVSIHLVFVCVCWIRSIAALQGGRQLARTISVSFMHLWRIQDRLEVSMVGSAGRGHFPEQIDGLLQKIQGMDYMSARMRVNPLLMGCILLDLQMRYLAIGHDTQLLSLPRVFCHIYSALRDRCLLDELPFIEDIIRVYETTIFTPSRAAATHGSFARSFLLSQTLIEANIVHRLGRQSSPSRPGQARSIVEKGRFDHISKVFRLLHGNDFTVLPPASSVSWRGLLGAVANVCKSELFETRVLSRDAFKFSNDLDDVVYSICDVMGRRTYVDRFARASNSRLRALENGAMLPLLPLLDALTDYDAVHSEDKAIEMCREVARIISRKFGDSSHVESDFFTFPATPAWVSAEFSESPLLEVTTPLFDEFSALLQMLQSSTGPLRGQKLLDFKQSVLASPSVLTLVLPETGTELSTLLHHAVAGPARDLYLTEWLIQVGALDMQLMYYRSPDLHEQVTKGTKFQDEWLPDALAVHCAAKKGYKKFVTFMLDADNFRDINTRTIHTKASLAQIAVQNGDKKLWAWLSLHDAVNSGVDATGKQIWECTLDRKWKSQLKHVVAEEKREAQKDGVKKWKYKKSPEEMKRAVRDIQVDLGSAILSNAPTQIVGSRDVELVSGQPVALGGKGKKNKKKKKLEHKQATHQSSPSGEIHAAQLMDQLFIDGNSNQRGDKTQALHAALEQLKNGAPTSAENRDACAASVLSIFEHYSRSAHNIVTAGLLSQGAAVSREVEDGARVAIMLNTFQQQFTLSANVVADPDSSTAKLFALLTPADDERFYEFFLLLFKTTLLAWYCHLRQLAQQLDATIERCLLSITDRSHGFRQMVSEYADVKKSAVSQKVAPQSDMQPQFEWYTSSHGIEDPWDLHRMDRLYGCRHYAKLQIVGQGAKSVPEACRDLIDDTVPHERHVVFVANWTIAGAKTTRQLEDVVAVVKDAAKQTGLALKYEEEELDMPSVEILGFMFSATGIVPSTP